MLIEHRSKVTDGFRISSVLTSVVMLCFCRLTIGRPSQVVGGEMAVRKERENLDAILDLYTVTVGVAT